VLHWAFFTGTRRRQGRGAQSSTPRELLPRGDERRHHERRFSLFWAAVIEGDHLVALGNALIRCSAARSPPRDAAVTRPLRAAAYAAMLRRTWQGAGASKRLQSRRALAALFFRGRWPLARGLGRRRCDMALLPCFRLPRCCSPSGLQLAPAKHAFRPCCNGRAPGYASSAALHFLTAGNVPVAPFTRQPGRRGFCYTSETHPRAAGSRGRTDWFLCDGGRARALREGAVLLWLGAGGPLTRSGWLGPVLRSGRPAGRRPLAPTGHAKRSHTQK